MPIEAMVDLTGGLAERYELKNKQMHKTLYKYLRKSFASQVVMFDPILSRRVTSYHYRPSSPAPGKETGETHGKRTRMDWCRFEEIILLTILT